MRATGLLANDIFIFYEKPELETTDEGSVWLRYKAKNDRRSE